VRGLLLAAALGTVSELALRPTTASAQQSQPVTGTRTVEVSGERWRLELRRDLGTFDFFVQPQGEAEFVSVLRPNGELPWYGYNVPGGGEARTCGVKPTVRIGGEKGPVSVRCELDEEHGVRHEAIYYGIDDGVVVVSRFTSSTPAPGASIVRFAPKLDVNIDLLTHYAFADAAGQQHEGRIADLGERNTYAGVGAWEPGGDQARKLDPERPYMLLYNPERQVSLGIILPVYRLAWREARSFLQLYQGGYNFWYTGFPLHPELRGERLFILYAKQSGSPEAIHEDAPRLCQEVERLVREGTVKAPDTQAALLAAESFEREWPAVYEQIRPQPPTGSAWLAMEMLRAARECADRDPVKAMDLLERAKAELAGR
jgi:hypothetical protein